MKRMDSNGSLFTDLYELTMAAGYFEYRRFEDATFSLFIRDMYPVRSFFLAGGLEDALQEISRLRFDDDDIDYLRAQQLFSEEFLAYLETFRFSGDVWAMPEGTLCFADEPLLEVTAPLIEAQLLETFLLNTIGFQTMIATKAARCVHAAAGRPLIDFALRRTQGKDAGLKVARAAYLAGFSGTSNVLAGKIYDIPVSGTMAHSFVEAFDSEFDAFEAYAAIFPRTSVFLIDTYDTLQGARHASVVARKMKSRGDALHGVRLDSGDMAKLSIEVRKILDGAGLPEVNIFASSGFDEYKLADVISRGAPIDAFGIGTKAGVSADAPYLDIVYKMVRYGDRNVRKLSPGKQTLAGDKQVFRRSSSKGRYREDIIGQRTEKINNAEPLLERVMRDGHQRIPSPPLGVLRKRLLANLNALDERCRALHHPRRYPIRISARLKRLQGSVQEGRPVDRRKT